MKEENYTDISDIGELYRKFLQEKKINNRDRKIDEILGNTPQEDEFLDLQKHYYYILQ